MTKNKNVKGDVAAIILAAGASRRMGTINKLLVQWQGRAMVRHIVQMVLKSDVAETIVVTGHDVDDIRQVLDGLDVRFVHNSRFSEGLSTSLSTGIAALGDNHVGAMIVLADMPGLKTETLNTLIKAFRDEERCSICVPVCGGRRGNPVIWPREFFPSILQLSGDRGARDLMTTFKDHVREIDVQDSGVLMDIDTPNDIP